MDEPIVLLPIIGNIEVITLQVALENYFKGNQGKPQYRNAARHMWRRLNKELNRE